MAVGQMAELGRSVGRPWSSRRACSETGRRARAIAGFCFDIRSISCSVNPLSRIAIRNAPKPSGGSALAFWPRSDDRMQNCTPTLRIGIGEAIDSGAGRRRTPAILPTNSMKAPCFAASCICGTSISTGAFIACVTTMCCTPCCRALAEQHQAFLSADTWPVASTSPCLAMTAMTAFVSGSSSPFARHADERPVLLRVAHLVFGVEGGHPDDAAPAAGDLASCARRPRDSSRRPSGSGRCRRTPRGRAPPCARETPGRRSGRSDS